jgi:ATP-binding protein involved in chromosome partitioning
MADPRLEIIGRRLEKVKQVIAVASGKGGVGKSMVATTLALLLSRRGHNVGLFDLDFTSPSTHIILGVDDLQPKEEKGIVPPVAHGLKYMSVTFYAADEPAPLRGADVSDAIVELMAITRWEELDYLVLDMPPGISDATLDMIRLMEGVGFLLVTTPSRVAFETVKKLLTLLGELGVPVFGVVENMLMKTSPSIQSRIEKEGAPYLGAIEFDPRLEEALGNIEALLQANFAKNLTEIVSKLKH